MGRTRGWRGAVALAAVVTALSPVIPSSNAVPRCADEARRTRADEWVALRKPAYTIGPGDLRAWSASHFVDGFLLATNGDAVARSTDGGCSWEETYTPGAAVGEARLLPGSQTIYDVALPPSPPGRLGYLAYVLISDIDGARVITSSDLGETWTFKPSAGLPALSQLHGMWVSANPNVAFVLADWRSTLTSVVETTLYVTRDAGQTFTPVTRGLQPGQYENVALDPIDTNSVWAWDSDSVFRSTNGGTTFFEVDVPGPISTIDILHFPAFMPARVMVYKADSPHATVSTDGGLTWKTERTPGRVTGSANLYTDDALAMASDKGVHLRLGMLGGQLRDVSPKGLRLTELAWSRNLPIDLSLYGRSGNDLYVRRFTQQLQPIKPPKPLPLPPVDLDGGAIIKQGPTVLHPRNATIKAKPGVPQYVKYQLDLAPVPTPLDIFFATDSTGSMSGVIASLRQDLQDIIDDLGESGIDVWFGVGDFKDYTTHGSPGDHPYKRFRAVGPIDDELAAAIEAIQIGGGNGLDSALTATYQAATGEGQMIVEGTPEAGYWVQPGNGAEWRKDSLKVVVIAADVRTRDPQSEPGYPGPSYAKTIGALNRLGIEHVGLAVGNQPDQPKQSLGRVSRGTGTLAPPGGIDCDDDGETDLEEGEPLVCELPVNDRGATNLAPAMVGLLRSLRDLQPVGMTLSGDRRIAKISSAPTFGDVNVKQPNKLPFTVEVTCDEHTAGKTFPVAVQTKVGTRTVATAKLTVACEALPVEVPPQVPPAIIVAVAAPAIAPPPPPAPIPQVQPQPNPNPNPNPNPQPAANAQAGMAFQDQAEVQLALAYDDITDEQQQSDQLAMVGLAVGAMMAAGCGVAIKRRDRHAPAPARVTSTW